MKTTTVNSKYVAGKHQKQSLCRGLRTVKCSTDSTSHKGLNKIRLNSAGELNGIYCDAFRCWGASPAGSWEGEHAVEPTAVPEATGVRIQCAASGGTLRNGWRGWKRESAMSAPQEVYF